MKKYIFMLLLFALATGCLVSCLSKPYEKQECLDDSGRVYLIRTKFTTDYYEDYSFHENGKPYQRKTYYVNDDGDIILHGESEGWFENGNRRYSNRYEHGKLCGICVEWLEDGRIKCVREFISTGDGINDISFISYYERKPQPLGSSTSHIPPPGGDQVTEQK
jgi:antitoxin component YwqK of YwqJK toxin-antitoxin module